MGLGEGGGVHSNATIPLRVMLGAGLTPTSSRIGMAGGLAEPLVGLAIPSVVLSSHEELPLNLRDFASGFGFVVYVYPGISNSRTMVRTRH